MNIVTVSSQYRVAIPAKVRQAAGIQAGQRVAIVLHEGRIALVPLRPMAELRGFAADINTRMEREADHL